MLKFVKDTLPIVNYYMIFAYFYNQTLSIVVSFEEYYVTFGFTGCCYFTHGIYHFIVFVGNRMV